MLQLLARSQDGKPALGNRFGAIQRPGQGLGHRTGRIGVSTAVHHADNSILEGVCPIDGSQGQLEGMQHEPL